jgi:4-amino-4-deoxy-L-arabinose transferase-like glycosyltransferase
MANAPSSFWNSPHSQSNLRLFQTIVWLITICAGLTETWASRFSINPDGNSYLDIASAYLRGDWGNAINAYWSPFYSWLLAVCLGVFRLGSYWESTILHILNFVGLLLSLCTFEFFFRGFLRLQSQWQSPQEEEQPLPELAWWALGYALFLSTSLLVLTVTDTTPDVWVAMFTYLVAGLTLRIAINSGGWQLFAALGFALGCSYLTKTFYFPMSFVFLATAWLATGKPRKTMKQAVLGFLVFTLVAGPWITALSRAKHRFTFGDVGKIAFAIFYDQLPQHFFWQGENGSGTPVHPVRQLMARPRLFEFAAPVAGAYPPAFDLSYWMEGVRPRFHLHELLKVLRQSAGTFFLIWTTQLEFALASLILFFLVRSNTDWLRDLRRQFYLWVPPLIACLNYFVVLVEFRYVAPFVLLLWLALFGSLFGAKSGVTRPFSLAIVFAILVVTGVRIAKSTTSDLAAVIAGQENVNWQVAEGLRKLRAQPGDRVAGLSRVAEAHWARLAGVKIVAEIPLGEENIFWAETPAEKQKVFQALASTGARFVVTKNPPACAQADGWVPLGRTGFYAFRLPSLAQSGSLTDAAP